MACKTELSGVNRKRFLLSILQKKLRGVLIKIMSEQKTVGLHYCVFCGI